MVPMWMYPVSIACGNTFVLKPSEKDPSCPMRLAEIAIEAGFPPGVLNVVNGDKEAVDTLLENKTVQAISFVGSTPIAEYVYHTGTKNNKRVQALGGAKNLAKAGSTAQSVTRYNVTGKTPNAFAKGVDKVFDLSLIHI